MQKDKQPLFRSFEKNRDYIRERLAVDKSFDIVQRDLEYAGVKMAFFLIDGLLKMIFYCILWIYLLI